VSADVSADVSAGVGAGVGDNGAVAGLLIRVDRKGVELS